MVKITWKKEDKHGSIYGGYANSVKLFEIIMLADGTMLSYILSSSLPGVESLEGKNHKELMVEAENILYDWFDRIGIVAVLE
jgi:hypothetical protein